MKGGALTYRAGVRNDTIVRKNNLLHNKQSQTGAMRLCRAEQIKDFQVLGDTDPGVTDVDGDGAAAQVSFNRQGAAVWHGLHGVFKKIEKCLLEFCHIAVDRRQVRRTL